MNTKFYSIAILEKHFEDIDKSGIKNGDQIKAAISKMAHEKGDSAADAINNFWMINLSLCEQVSGIDTFNTRTNLLEYTKILDGVYINSRKIEIIKQAIEGWSLAFRNFIFPDLIKFNLPIRVHF